MRVSASPIGTPAKPPGARRSVALRITIRKKKVSTTSMIRADQNP
jgi:hypothetical protein